MTTKTTNCAPTRRSIIPFYPDVVEHVDGEEGKQLADAKILRVANIVDRTVAEAA